MQKNLSRGLISLYSFLLCPLTFFFSRITTIMFFLLMIAGGYEYLKTDTRDVFPERERVNFSSLLFFSITLTLCLLFMDIHTAFFRDFVRRVSAAKLHTVPAISIAMLVWIPLFSFFKRKQWALFMGLYILTFYVLKKCACDAAFFAFIIGSATFLLGRFPGFLKKASYSYLLVFLMPWLFTLTPSDIQKMNQDRRVCDFSYVHRLYILQDVCMRIRTAPWPIFLLGDGINSSRKTLREKPIHQTFYECHSSETASIPQGYFHPHNIPLQIWRDLGLIGVLVFCYLFIRIPFRGPVQSAWIAVCCFLSLISFGLFEWWWIGLIVITGFLIRDADYVTGSPPTRGN